MIGYKTERKIFNYTLVFVLLILPFLSIFVLESNKEIMAWMNEHIFIAILLIWSIVAIISKTMTKWEHKINDKAFANDDEEKFNDYREKYKDRRTLKEKLHDNKKHFKDLLLVLWFFLYWIIAIGLTFIIPFMLITNNHLSMYLFFVVWILLSLALGKPLVKMDVYIKTKIENM